RGQGVFQRPPENGQEPRLAATSEGPGGRSRCTERDHPVSRRRDMSTPGFAQPNASRFTRDMRERILASIEPGAERLLEKVVHRDQHSNDLAELRLKDGRSLIVKGVRYDWAAARFAASRLASRLIREASTLLVPAPLEVPAPADGRAIEVYWRIDRPTLQEVWPHLDARH